MENAISNLAFGGWKIWGGKCYLEISNLGWWKIWGGNCYLESRILGVENLGWKMLSRISNLGCGKFGVENVISNLEFGVWKIWGGKCYSKLQFGGGVENLGGKCYLESRIWGVENLG